MAGNMVFSIEFIPMLDILVEQFDFLSTRLRSTREPLKQTVREVFIPWFDEEFYTEGHGEWPEHAEMTTRIHGEHPLLQLGGKLHSTSLQQNLWNFTSDSASLENLDKLPDYWAAQHFGAQIQVFGRGEAEIPPRPWFTMPPDAEDEMALIFSAWLDDKIAEAGF